MPATIYEKLFSRLADLIAFENAPEGSVFCATPRLVGDLAVYCHVSAAEGSMRIIEMADDNPKTGGRTGYGGLVEGGEGMGPTTGAQRA